MSEAPIQLPLLRGGHGSNVVRSPACETRGADVRLVEYCPFPRATAARGWRLGFALDVSSSGLWLEVEPGLRIGSLLRVTLRSIDGRPTLDVLARVVEQRLGDGRCEVELQLLSAADELLRALAPRPVRAAHLRMVAQSA